MPTQVAVQLFVGVINWIAMWHRTLENPDEINQIADLFVDFCQKGILISDLHEHGGGTV